MKTQTNNTPPLSLRICVLVAALVALPLSTIAASVAMVTDLQGKATVTDAGRSFEATIYAEIESGAQVQLQTGGVLTALYLEGGNEFVFKGPAQIVFRPGQPEVISGSAPAKRTPSLGTGVRIKPIGLGQGALVLRGPLANTRIKLLTATGTRVLETQPDFRWQEPQPGLKYQIEIADETGRSLYEAQVESASFALPHALQLKDGQSYTWEVSTRLPDGRKYSSIGVFSVASADLRAQAEVMRVEASSSVSSSAIYAAWLDQVELKDEARKYWRELYEKRPEDVRLKELVERR